jgi:hypothetical protein
VHRSLKSWFGHVYVSSCRCCNCSWYFGRGWSCSLDRNKCARIVTVSTREYIWDAFVFPFRPPLTIFVFASHEMSIEMNNLIDFNHRTKFFYLFSCHLYSIVKNIFSETVIYFQNFIRISMVYLPWEGFRSIFPDSCRIRISNFMSSQCTVTVFIPQSLVTLMNITTNIQII